MNQLTYLTDIPQSVESYGFCKVLQVRHEIIHLKHILTEIFVKKSIDISNTLDELGLTLFDYMGYITNRLRKVHHISREYAHNVNEIVKVDRDRFFPELELYKGLNACIVLDFDGVITNKSFKELYQLCIDRAQTFVCSGNPTISSDWFISHEYPLPSKIYSCKGKIKKLKQLLEISKRHDFTLYVDNEDLYLEYAWIFGIHTYKYINKQIKYFSLIK
jgi:hypothetical protein